MTATVLLGAATARDAATNPNSRESTRTTAVASRATALARDVLERIVFVMNLQAVNGQWRDRVQLAPGFAEDVARNVVAGLVDQLADLGAERNARTHRK